MLFLICTWAQKIGRALITPTIHPIIQQKSPVVTSDIPKSAIYQKPTEKMFLFGHGVSS